MRTIIICLLLFCHYYSFGQTNISIEDNTPIAKAQKYALQTIASPESAGSTNYSSASNIEAGQQVWLNAYNNTGFKFVKWMCADSLVSEASGFYFTMPANDVVLTAIFEYNPENPPQPDSLGLSHTLTVVALPEKSGSFNVNKTLRMVEGESVNLYAYPNTGFTFEGWDLGDTIIRSEEYRFTMGEKDVDVIARFTYNPENPSDPGSNYWNETTGEVIVDDFTPGRLSTAIYNAIGNSNNSDVTMITVAGQMNSSDFGIANNYDNCTLLDLSRVTGITEVPSYAFDYTNLESVYLPATIEKIGYRAFADCQNLSSLTCYAMTPPVLEDYVFKNVPEGLVVYVPAAAIAQYQDAEGWKDFTILPILEDVHNLDVRMPESCDVNLYLNNVLELTNKQNGQRYKAIITKQSVYSFPYLIKHTKYDLKLLNGRKLVLGTINDICIENNDTTVTFSSLLQPQKVSIEVLLPNGNKVTDKVAITWKDKDGNYLYSGSVLDNVVEGYSLIPSVTLPKELAIKYAQPRDIEYTVTSESNLIKIVLTTHPIVSFDGNVINNITRMPIEGALVSVSQMIDGKYLRTEQTQTDSMGFYMLTAIKGPATINHSSNNFLTSNDTVDFTSVAENISLDKKELQPINGFKMGVAFTLTPSSNEEKKVVPLVWSSDADDVSYEITNYTKGIKVNNFINQYPLIILPNGIEEGDSLLITAKARDNVFMPVTVGCKASTNGCSIVFPFLELGQLKAVCQQNKEINVIGILYDATGTLVKKNSYTNGELQMNNITDGEYWLVTMTESTLFNSISRISALSESGLEEGKDYLLNKIALQSGKITEVENGIVPVFDDSRFNYTSSDSYFSVNKASILAGNFLTMQACLTFKDKYVEQIQNARIMFELPEGTAFVDNSAMIGTKKTTYELDRNKLTISVDGHLGERIRFCVIPETEGKITPTAYALFTYDGKEMKQPLGSVTCQVQSIAINSPSIVSSPEFVVSGVVTSGAIVDVYDGNMQIGSTKALANGVWNATCKLKNTRNLSSHTIHAVATTKIGAKVKTETKHVLYDKSAIEVSKVHMYHWNPELNINYDVVYDFQNPSQSAQKYTYYIYNREFTFTIDFTSNDTTRISDVKLRVKTGNDSYVILDAKYSTSKKCWVATGEFGNMYDGIIPRNVDVHYLCKNKSEVELDGFRNFISGDVQKELTAYKDAYLTVVKQALSLDDEQACDDLFVKTFGTQEVCDDVYSFDELKNISEEELLEMLDQSITEIISYNSESQSNQQDEDFNEFDFTSNGNRFIRKRCDDLDSALLVQQDFIVIPSTDGAPLYCRTLDGAYEIADFVTNTYLGVFFDDKALARSRNADNDDSIIKSLSNNLNTFDVSFSVAEQNADVEKLRLGRELRKAIRIRKMCETRGFENGLLKWRQNESDVINSIYWLGWKTSVIKALGKAVDFYGKYQSSEEAVENTIDTWNLQNYLPDDLPVSNMDYEAIQQLKNEIRRKSADQATSHIIKNGVQMAIVKGLVWSAAICPWSLIITIPATLGSMYAVNDYFSDVTRNTYNQMKNQVSKYRNRLGLPSLDIDWESSGNLDNDVSIDPSGYVYEGVSSNRVEGVIATAFYKEYVEDMYGDLHENIVKWDAEEYAQENPLFTDENGMYRWDVPQGLWQVKFEKEGYETTYSDWLPVPPPQLEVNIPMKQNVQPNVKSARAFENAVEVQFDKYMMPEMLTTENIMVLADENVVEGTIELLDEEVSYEGETNKYASKIRFNAKEPFSTEEVTLIVKNRVKSYAGIRMQDDFSQNFTVELEVRKIECDSVLAVIYGEQSTITVQVHPASAAAGKTLKVKSLAPLLLSVDKNAVALDAEGKAEITISGDLPGTAALSFEVDGYDISATSIVKIGNMESLMVATPTTSIASGSEVAAGTEIYLSCATENAAIYYTLDGTCPCENTSSVIRYDGTPIVINETTTIKAIAYAEGMYESEVATFVYTVNNGSGIDEEKTGKYTVYPQLVKDIVNIDIPDDVSANVCIASVHGQTVYERKNMTGHNAVDMTGLTKGMYVVAIRNGNELVSIKIIKIGD